MKNKFWRIFWELFFYNPRYGKPYGNYYLRGKNKRYSGQLKHKNKQV